MRIFISHSWKNKTVADKLADDCTPLAEVWLDLLQPREEDQHSSSDQALEDIDLILLLWSRHAVDCEYLNYEIEASLRLKKIVIPCCLDETPIPVDWKIPFKIDFSFYKLGLARVCCTVLHYLSDDLSSSHAQAINSFGTIEEALVYVKSYTPDYQLTRQVEHYKGIISKILSQPSFALTDGSVQSKDVDELVQNIRKQMAEAGNSRSKFQEILQEVIKNEFRDPEIFKEIRIEIENLITSLPTENDNTFENVYILNNVQHYKYGFKNDREKELTEIKEQLEPLFNGNELNQATELLHYYICSSSEAYEILAKINEDSPSYGGGVVMQNLARYIDNPDDFFPESEFGFLGYTDDAWLIHNTAYRLIESDHISELAFPLRWDEIIAADNIVRAILPLQVLSQLESMLLQYLRLINKEQHAYEPQFHKSDHNYHAYMGRGKAILTNQMPMSFLYKNLDYAKSQKILESWTKRLKVNH
ncbi:TIR domain-containing protein [Fulvivirgaceae bacterium BMA10]|uniref:TIR domain-containing protein n=1 Tax=Splendidivirga corallicola TaxID=3051826 RepID=A0ABT8KM98_9BACT|nr:TIR domain-containing protein [Fulvivirgaceae bacterium BMA10]